MSLTKEQMREYQRKRRAAKKGEVNLLSPNIPQADVTILRRLNETDRTFEAANPGYYIYEPEEREAMCHLSRCSKKFKTRLALNKFCCREHQSEFISQHSTAGSKIGTDVVP